MFLPLRCGSRGAWNRTLPAFVMPPGPGPMWTLCGRRGDGLSSPSAAASAGSALRNRSNDALGRGCEEDDEADDADAEAEAKEDEEDEDAAPGSCGGGGDGMPVSAPAAVASAAWDWWPSAGGG